MSHKHKHAPKKVALDELEALYEAQDSPVVPINGYVKPTKPDEGYIYYQKIREHLPEWWESFNGSLDSYGRLKYTTVRKFIEKKASQGRQRAWLYQMIGPANKRAKETTVPWLGDWDKRRRNGFGVLDNAEKIKPLIKAIKSNVAAAESIKSITPLLVEELVQFNNLQKQVHEAFAGRAFMDNRKADDGKNQSRFKAYHTMLWTLTQLKIAIIHEIIRCHGVDPNIPNQMREMAQIAGAIGASAALTGIAAQQSAGVTSIDGKIIAPYTYDAIKLAEHLTHHAHTFKKPLPIDIEGEVVEKDSSSSSSGSKHNGKTQ